MQTHAEAGPVAKLPLAQSCLSEDTKAGLNNFKTVSFAFQLLGKEE